MIEKTSWLLLVMGVTVVTLCVTFIEDLSAEVIYQVFQFPDNLIPIIDGDLSDWEIVPESYVKDIEDIMSGFGNPIDLDNFSVRAVVGWNDRENRLYFAAEVFDDLHKLRSESNDIGDMVIEDSFAIFLDADHSGGKFRFPDKDMPREERKRWHNAQAQEHFLAVSTSGTAFFANDNASTWSENPPWSEYAGRIEEEPMGGTTVFYEVAIVPFDDLNWVGPEESVIHDLEEGEIVGLSYGWNDLDETFSDVWHIAPATKSTDPYSSDHWPHFLLSPFEEGLITSVEATTWGRIKATFVR